MAWLKNGTEGGLHCFWCGRAFTPRATGGHPQTFCKPACRRAFHAEARTWVLAELAAGHIAISEVKNGSAATRALCGSGDRASPLPDTGSPENALPDLMARFLVEVPRSTIEAFVRFGFIRPNQQDDLAAIMGALRLLGRAPAVSRIG
jgi:hypothetical protein